MPGRAHRHAGDGDAGDRWLFLQQLLYDVGGHVAFDDVAGDERRVAGRKIRRHAVG